MIGVTMGGMFATIKIAHVHRAGKHKTFTEQSNDVDT
jgi:hypothetical protein